MQRWNRAACAAMVTVGLAAAWPASAARPAPGLDGAAAVDWQCDVPAEARREFAARRAQGATTREEVRADVEVWRASGMAQLSRARPLPDVFSERYRQHYATYLRMRGGPEFEAALCRELQDAR